MMQSKKPVIGENPSYEAENQRDDNLYVIDTKHSGTLNGIVWEEGISGNSLDRSVCNSTGKRGFILFAAY